MRIVSSAPDACVECNAEAGTHAALQAPTTYTGCDRARHSVSAGATFDVLDPRSFEEFEQLPEHAFASLNDDDRQKIQQSIKQWE